MDIESIPLFSMLRSRLSYLNQRQVLIAQNVANASTPGFTPQDLKPFTVKANGSLPMLAAAQTDTGHLSGMIALNTSSTSAQQGFQAVAAPDDETQLDGNQVVMENQMMKMSETRSDYEAAVGIYQKALSFLELAAKEPGK
jgi:flagellar basal-body rod protein FlgB